MPALGFVAGRVITGLADNGAGGASRPPRRPGRSRRPGAVARPPRCPTSRASPSARCRRSPASRRGRSCGASPSPFDSFFGFDDDDFFGGGSRVQSSLGSGVVVGADGYILTNNHVVTGEQQRVSLRDLNITVSLGDKRDVAAALIGVDPATDLALLKIDAKSLPTIPWGDSSKLHIAEWVLAIGNPYQLNSTVTLGIVSAVSRTNLGISAYEDFVQTDAAINPGNSGGALVNARGELVGINTVIFSQSGGYQGIGFAVSSNLARARVQRPAAVRRGAARRRSATSRCCRSRRSSRSELSAPDTQGLAIAGIGRSAASAYRAGLRVGDVIRDASTARPSPTPASSID